MPADAPSYDDVHSALKSLQSGVGAADLHGSLSGFLCAGGEGLQGFLRAMDLDELLEPAGQDAGAAGVLLQIFRSCGAQLDDSAFQFDPLLPADEAPLPERAQALVQWCQGFIGGLGLGGFDRVERLSEEGREVLGDIAEIAGSRLDFDDKLEVDELALGELLEFVRVGALLLREDLRVRREH